MLYPVPRRLNQNDMPLLPPHTRACTHMHIHGSFISLELPKSLVEGSVNSIAWLFYYYLLFIIYQLNQPLNWKNGKADRKPKLGEG